VQSPRGGEGKFSKVTKSRGAVAPDLRNGLLIPTKVAVKKPHRKPLKNRPN
jgi:hypothetical protein